VESVWPRENNWNAGYDHGSRGVRFDFSGCAAVEVMFSPIGFRAFGKLAPLFVPPVIGN
jgi:hypothetical protein